jgi:hypothetical protein
VHAAAALEQIAGDRKGVAAGGAVANHQRQQLVVPKRGHVSPLQFLAGTIAGEQRRYPARAHGSSARKFVAAWNSQEFGEEALRRCSFRDPFAPPGLHHLISGVMPSTAATMITKPTRSRTTP